MAWILSSVTVVICRRCTFETRPSVKDEYVDAILPAKRFDRGGAGVARGRADDRDAKTALLQA